MRENAASSPHRDAAMKPFRENRRGKNSKPGTPYSFLRNEKAAKAGWEETERFLRR
jgi:hypothetical protein